MRQMWLVGFLVLLLGLSYLGWLAVRSSSGMPSETPAAGRGEAMPDSKLSSAGLILRLHGSNTIGAQLAPMLAQAFLKAQGAKNISTKSTSVDELTVIGTLAGKRQGIGIKAHGSATAFLDLASGECDIGMASRRIQPSEAANLSSLGDMTSPASEHVLCLGAVAVIVNRGNPLSSLSKEDIARIFAGEVKQWKEVGGSGGPIKLYARDVKSGTFDTFKSLVLEGEALSPDTVRIEDSRQLSAKVSHDPDAIGFVGLTYVLDAKALAVSENGAKALLPTALTVSTEDYALSRRLYLYTASNPTNPMVRRFVDFALGKPGQELVTANGFVDLTVKAEPVSVAPDAPAGYQRLTKGAERLSVNFRFQPGSSTLDNKAMPDVDRVSSFLSASKYTGADVMLLGFSDSSGDRDINCHLSKDRAKVVSDALSQHGVMPATVEGFCSELPVDSNDTEDGREKNRRVEIWIKKH